MEFTNDSSAYADGDFHGILRLLPGKAANKEGARFARAGEQSAASSKAGGILSQRESLLSDFHAAGGQPSPPTSHNVVRPYSKQLQPGDPPRAHSAPPRRAGPPSRPSSAAPLAVARPWSAVPPQRPRLASGRPASVASRPGSSASRQAPLHDTLGELPQFAVHGRRVVPPDRPLPRLSQQHDGGSKPLLSQPSMLPPIRGAFANPNVAPGGVPPPSAESSFSSAASLQGLKPVRVRQRAISASVASAASSSAATSPSQHPHPVFLVGNNRASTQSTDSDDRRSQASRAIQAASRPSDAWGGRAAGGSRPPSSRPRSSRPSSRQAPSLVDLLGGRRDDDAESIERSSLYVSGRAVQLAGQAAGDAEVAWDSCFKTLQEEAPPWSAEDLMLMMASISPKFSMRRPDDYVPLTPASLAGSRYRASFSWSQTASPVITSAALPSPNHPDAWAAALRDSARVHQRHGNSFSSSSNSSSRRTPSSSSPPDYHAGSPAVGRVPRTASRSSYRSHSFNSSSASSSADRCSPLPSPAGAGVPSPLKGKAAANRASAAAAQRSTSFSSSSSNHGSIFRRAPSASRASQQPPVASPQAAAARGAVQASGKRNDPLPPIKIAFHSPFTAAAAAAGRQDSAGAGQRTLSAPSGPPISAGAASARPIVARRVSTALYRAGSEVETPVRHILSSSPITSSHHKTRFYAQAMPVSGEADETLSRPFPALPRQLQREGSTPSGTPLLQPPWRPSSSLRLSTEQHSEQKLFRQGSGNTGSAWVGQIKAAGGTPRDTRYTSNLVFSPDGDGGSWPDDDEAYMRTASECLQRPLSSASSVSPGGVPHVQRSAMSSLSRQPSAHSKHAGWRPTDSPRDRYGGPTKHQGKSGTASPRGPAVASAAQRPSSRRPSGSLLWEPLPVSSLFGARGGEAGKAAAYPVRYAQPAGQSPRQQDLSHSSRRVLSGSPRHHASAATRVAPPSPVSRSPSSVSASGSTNRSLAPPITQMGSAASSHGNRLFIRVPSFHPDHGGPSSAASTTTAMAAAAKSSSSSSLSSSRFRVATPQPGASVSPFLADAHSSGSWSAVAMRRAPSSRQASSLMGSGKPISGVVGPSRGSSSALSSAGSARKLSQHLGAARGADDSSVPSPITAATAGPRPRRSAVVASRQQEQQQSLQQHQQLLQQPQQQRLTPLPTSSYWAPHKAIATDTRLPGAPGAPDGAAPGQRAEGVAPPSAAFPIAAAPPAVNRAVGRWLTTAQETSSSLIPAAADISAAVRIGPAVKKVQTAGQALQPRPGSSSSSAVPAELQPRVPSQQPKPRRPRASSALRARYVQATLLSQPGPGGPIGGSPEAAEAPVGQQEGRRWRPDSAPIGGVRPPARLPSLSRQPASDVSPAAATAAADVNSGSKIATQRPASSGRHHGRPDGTRDAEDAIPHAVSSRVSTRATAAAATAATTAAPFVPASATTNLPSATAVTDPAAVASGVSGRMVAGGATALAAVAMQVPAPARRRPSVRSAHLHGAPHSSGFSAMAPGSPVLVGSPAGGTDGTRRSLFSAFETMSQVPLAVGSPSRLQH